MSELGNTSKMGPNFSHLSCPNFSNILSRYTKGSADLDDYDYGDEDEYSDTEDEPEDGEDE